MMCYIEVPFIAGLTKLLCSVLMLFLYLQLTRLQKENDSLIGKHSKYAEQLQNEDINLPSSMEVCN